MHNTTFRCALGTKNANVIISFSAKEKQIQIGTANSCIKLAASIYQNSGLLLSLQSTQTAHSD